MYSIRMNYMGCWGPVTSSKIAATLDFTQSKAAMPLVVRIFYVSLKKVESHITVIIIIIIIIIIIVIINSKMQLDIVGFLNVKHTHCYWKQQLRCW